MEYGFIGTGKMGGAIAQKIAENGIMNIALANRTAEKAKSIAEKIGGKVFNNTDIAKNAKYIFLGVKPQIMPEIAVEIKPILKSRNDKFVLVSMAAGLSINALKDMFGNYPVIRIMPNTPLTLGEGMVLYTANGVDKCDLSKFCKDMIKCGILEEIPEELMDAGCVVSGCGPAFFYLFIDAVAKAGEKLGLKYETALKLAAQTAIGSGAMVLNSKKDAATLVNDVCSKGGSTIEGLNYFNSSEFNDIINNALTASYNRTKELGKFNK